MRRPLRAVRALQRLGSLIVLAVLAAGLVVFLVLPKAERSERENRRLAALPPLDRAAILDGRYTQALETYVADHFPYRDGWLRLADRITALRGIGTPEIQVFPGVAEPMGQGTTAEAPSRRPEAVPGQTTPAGPDAAVVGQAPDTALARQRASALVIHEGRAVQSFLPRATASTRYARVTERWKAALGPAVRLHVMAVPIGSDFYLPTQLRGAAAHERANIENLYRALPEGVIPVRAYEELAAHRDEPIYFRTDHHWTGRGAYYGYLAFAQAAGFAPLPLDALTRRACGRFLGSLYNQTRSEVLREAPDSVEMFMIGNRVEVRQLLHDQVTWHRGALYLGCRGYQSFLGIDYPLMVITSDVANGQRILVVKDSYGNAFVPFLAAHFEKVVVVDYRYFAGSVRRLVEEQGLQAVVFVHNLQAINAGYTTSKEIAMLEGAPPLPLEPRRPALSDSAAPPPPTAGPAPVRGPPPAAP